MTTSPLAQGAPRGRGTMRGPIVRCPVPVKNQRRVLCVFPSYVPAFGTFQHAYKLMYGVKAFMPPQGLLLIAAYVPESWPVRFVDENRSAATPEDFHWADAVLVSGMHVQQRHIEDITRRAHACGKAVATTGLEAPFGRAKLLRNAYLTDALQQRIDDYDRHREWCTDIAPRKART